MQRAAQRDGAANNKAPPRNLRENPRTKTTECVSRVYLLMSKRD